jgi:hypothetical protein
LPGTEVDDVAHGRRNAVEASFAEIAKNIG